MLWWLGSLVPLLKIFTEEVHLCYALVPFAILAAAAVQYLERISRGPGAVRTTARLAVLILATVGAGDQLLNVPNSIRVVWGITGGIRAAGGQNLPNRPGGRCRRGQRPAPGRYSPGCPRSFQILLDCPDGDPHGRERSLPTTKAVLDFMAQKPKTPVYFLEMDYEYLPYKRGYHSHRLAKGKDFNSKLWSLSPTDIRCPFLDPGKIWLWRTRS